MQHEQQWIEFSAYWMLAGKVYRTKVLAYRAAQKLSEKLHIPVDTMQDEAGWRLITQYRPGSR